MQQFNIDISQPRGPLVLYASQGDSLSRFFAVTVTDNGAAYEAPSGAIYTVRFGAPGMPAGWYDTITEVGGGTHPAVVVDENTCTVEIAEQAVSVPGTNALVLIISDAAGYTLASWAFELQVAAVPGYDAPEATVYYNALTEQVAQVLANAQAAATSASAAAASATQAQQYAESINPANFATAAQGTKADSAVQTVNGLAGPNPTLTAANVGAATAAQGTLADSAVQPYKAGDEISYGSALLAGRATASNVQVTIPLARPCMATNATITGRCTIRGADSTTLASNVEFSAAAGTSENCITITIPITFSTVPTNYVLVSFLATSINITFS